MTISKKLSNLLPRALIKGSDIIGTKKAIDKMIDYDKNNDRKGRI